MTGRATNSRRRAATIELVLAALVAPVTAAEARLTIAYRDGSPAHVLQAWADASHVPTAPGVVTVLRNAGDCAGRTCTTARGDVIWWSATPVEARNVLLHELGHRFDYRVMTTRRARCSSASRATRHRGPARAATRRMSSSPRPTGSVPALRGSGGSARSAATPGCRRRRSIDAPAAWSGRSRLGFSRSRALYGQRARAPRPSRVRVRDAKPRRRARLRDARGVASG